MGRLIGTQQPEEASMAFTSKSKVVARIDTVRNEIKAAAIKTIEENMKTTNTVSFNVYFKGGSLHVEDMKTIIDGYAARGWSVGVKTTQAHCRDGGAEVCFMFS